ncbi:MAG: FixH family protein [Syntrophorhabdaceae bacterium]
MKTFVTIVLIMLLTVSVAYAKDYEVNKKAGDLNVTIRIDKNPPVAGPNNVEIGITDASGKAVTDAKVIFGYSMPAMPGMPAANYKSEAVLSGNIYKVRVNYSMSGSWNNEIKITRGGKAVSTRFTIDAK